MRTLLGQLLLKFPNLNYEYLIKHRDKNEISIGFLYGALENLLIQLPPEVVLFCAIEGVKIYEDQASVCEEVEEVIEFLICASQRSVRCAFKLILACPWNSHKFYKLAPDQDKDVLWIPSQVPRQPRLTSTVWNMLMKTNFQFLR